MTARVASGWGAVVLAVGASCMTAACGLTPSINYTVDPDVLASQVAEELAASIGEDTPPDLTCGTEVIRIEEGRVVDCILSVPGDVDRFPVVVKLVDTNGAKFSFDAKVGGEPLPR